MHIYIRCADDIWPIFDSTAQHMACTYMDLYEWFITHWLSKMVSKLNNWQANREICARVMRNEYARRMELNISIHSIYLLFKWLLNNNIPVAVECMKRHWWEKTRRSARFFELCVFCVLCALELLSVGHKKKTPEITFPFYVIRLFIFSKKIPKSQPPHGIIYRHLFRSVSRTTTILRSFCSFS